MIHSSASITASIVKVNPYIRTGSSLVKTNKSLHTTHHITFLLPTMEAYYLRPFSINAQLYSRMLYICAELYFVYME